MTNEPHPFDPTDEALLTAYALGELEGAEAAAAERLLAADPSAAAVVNDVCRTASWLTDGLKAEPDLGLTAIHVASIERQLARLAEVDAPQPEPLPLRRNWQLWGSVAASTLIVATVMAGVLPLVFQENRSGPGGGGGGASNTAAPSASFDNGASRGSGGLIMSTGPGGMIGKTTTGDGADAGDWPILRTSAGGLPWPAVLSRQTGFYEPAFVVPSDFPVAVIPPTPNYAQTPGRGSLAAIRSSLEAGRFPSPQSVRADELVNSLQYESLSASPNEPVAAVIESAVCPWNTGHLLVRVAIRSSDRPAGPRSPAGDDAPALASPALIPLVRDLRLVVEVNPAAAAGYRVIGYENGPRSWGEWSGRDDHEVLPPGTAFTALLEVVPTGQALPEASTRSEPRKYQKREPLVVNATELLTVSVQYRQGTESAPAKLDLPVSVGAQAIELASPDFRAAAGAAALGLSLRHANPASDPMLSTAIKLLTDVTVTATTPSSDRQGLLEVARKVQTLNGRSDENAR